MIALFPWFHRQKSYLHIVSQARKHIFELVLQTVDFWPRSVNEDKISSPDSLQNFEFKVTPHHFQCHQNLWMVLDRIMNAGFKRAKVRF